VIRLTVLTHRSAQYGNQQEGLKAVARELNRVTVAADTYRVSSEPVLLVTDLTDAMALCLHDEARGVGGLLHLRFSGGRGRPSNATDYELSSVLSILDRFTMEVLGNAAGTDEVQARILAHSLPSVAAGESGASLVDLIKAELVDGKIICGTQTLRRPEPVRVCFQPFDGRVWIRGPADAPRRASAARR
jgi:chemotaxis receptor (MCP) glutamine deamidase CheD